MPERPKGRDLVRAVLANPPRRDILASVLRGVRPPIDDLPLDSAARWAALGDGRPLDAVFERVAPDDLERATLETAPDAFMATEGAPSPPEQAFEDLPSAEAVVRALGAQGHSAQSIADALRALRAAWPLFDRRPPETWSAAEAAWSCARLLEMGAGPVAARRLIEGMWALWTALGRQDRIDGLAAVLRTLRDR